MKNKKWRIHWLEVVVVRSVSCLLFIPVGRLVSHHSVLFRLLVYHIHFLLLTFLSFSKYTVFKSISRRWGGGSENTSSHRSRRPGMRSRGSKWGWYSERSWLLVIGNWSPCNQELITHQSRTHPQLPRSYRNKQQSERWVFGGRSITDQFWRNPWRDRGIQRSVECVMQLVWS